MPGVLSRQRRLGGWLGRIAGAGLVSLSLCGCAGFWDEVTSRNFNIKHFWEPPPNPFVVLKDSDDGDQRAKALRALRDPKQYGGSPKDQEAVLNILATAASKERQFLCRMAAVESLGHFQDPRAVDGLTKAFYSSTSFSQDLTNRLQMQVATALGNTRQPGAEQFLLMLVQEKPQVEGSDQEKQQNLDVRLAATRALGNFNDPRAAQLLQGMVKAEKDVALRDCAKDALLASSGQKPPLIDLKVVEELILPASFRQADDDDGPAPVNAPGAATGVKGSNPPPPAPIEPENKQASSITSGPAIAR